MDLKNKIKLWVQGQLVTMPRGAKKKLADYLKITPTQLTRLLNLEAGKEPRSMQADEFLKIVEFFGKWPDNLMPSIFPDSRKQHLLAMFDSVSPEWQQAIIAMVEALVQSSKRP
ncbi:hypothetical protein [Bartonella choladocola]|uniref:HTH cro/C1-type domain-containing protein n=1 Tax=Bartonella choladocola TaxID=2750995 RepID=A0A1U9MJG4_9HYPH|nr:hypothetical protein [Bartonella choladocola]AQT47859.1 hypothetical protein BBC0122_017600 [Bartonella choladocola]